MTHQTICRHASSFRVRRLPAVQGITRRGTSVAVPVGLQPPVRHPRLELYLAVRADLSHAVPDHVAHQELQLGLEAVPHGQDEVGVPEVAVQLLEDVVKVDISHGLLVELEADDVLLAQDGGAVAPRDLPARVLEKGDDFPALDFLDTDTRRVSERKARAKG